MTLLFFDIETTGINSLKDRIIAIGVATEKTDPYIIMEPDEKTMIKELADLLPATLVGFNIRNFDIPFLTSRAIINDLENYDIFMKSKYIDLFDIVKTISTGGKWPTLNYTCQCLGIDVYADISGAYVPGLWVKALKGDEKAKRLIEDHCRKDVLKIKKLYYKLRKLIEKDI